MKKNILYTPNIYLNCFEKFSVYKDNCIFKEFYFYFPYQFSLIRCSNYDFCDIISKINFDEFCNRFSKGEKEMKKEFKQVITKEENLSYSDDDLFNITSWGADLSFRELILMYNDKDLIKPNFQRNYVWKLDEASRLIDSILLGLPIPSIFLAKKMNSNLSLMDIKELELCMIMLKEFSHRMEKYSNCLIQL